MVLKDPYLSPTSPTTADDNLITSTESEIGRPIRFTFIYYIGPILYYMFLLVNSTS